MTSKARLTMASRFAFIPLKKTEVIGRNVWNFLTILLVRDVLKIFSFIVILPDYTGGILQRLDTDVHSTVTAKTSTAL